MTKIRLRFSVAQKFPLAYNKVIILSLTENGRHTFIKGCPANFLGVYSIAARKVRIMIPGRPVPKARPRAVRNGNKIHLFTPGETVKYEKHVHIIASKFFIEPWECPVEVKINVYFDPDRKKPTKNGRMVKITIPDLDNCIKSILDGLNKLAYKDDRQVHSLAP